jgi:hypothetical protein
MESRRQDARHIGEEGTHWGFKEKVALLEVVLEQHLPGKLFWPDIVQQFKELTNSVRTEAACRQQWKNIGIDNNKFLFPDNLISIQ